MNHSQDVPSQQEYLGTGDSNNYRTKGNFGCVGGDGGGRYVTLIYRLLVDVDVVQRHVRGAQLFGAAFRLFLLRDLGLDRLRRFSFRSTLCFRLLAACIVSATADGLGVFFLLVLTLFAQV